VANLLGLWARMNKIALLLAVTLAPGGFGYRERRRRAVTFTLGFRP